MGLDWFPRNRPKPGMENEYAALVALDFEALPDKEARAATRRFKLITESAAGYMRSPDIPPSVQADPLFWIDSRRLEAAQMLANPRRFSAEALRAVMNSARPQDRHSSATHPQAAQASATHSSDSQSLGKRGAASITWWVGYSYRGQLLEDVRHVIGDELFNRAWQTMTSKELHEYGTSLEAALLHFARQHRHELAMATEAERDDPDSPASKAEVLSGAASWCLWWSSRGFGLSPDY